MANTYLTTGSKGKNVEAVQKMLNENGYNLDTDGVFGPKTLSAVKDYQKKNGLKVDGIVGNKTMVSLEDTYTTPGFKSQPPAAEVSATGGKNKSSGLTGEETYTTPGFKVNPGTAVSDSAADATVPSKGNTTPATGVATLATGSATPTTGNTAPTTANDGAGAVAQGGQSYSYAPFQESQSTQNADAQRQQLQSQKPGDFSYADYGASESVLQAQALLQQQLANKPGEYFSQYSNQMQAIMDQYMNRDKFSYDMNSDALYRQYADQYQMMGQQAMMDTMGQAQAMTGGYGNSYAQSVGQQAYQGYLQQLNEVVPELYQMAYNRYNQEGQDMLNQYGLLSSQDQLEYGRYRDQVSDYYTELNRLTEDARYKAEDDYGKYMDKYNMSYGQYRDSVSDWQNELNRADSEYWKQYSADYDQYSNDRNLDYDNYWNEKNMAYQQERDQASDDKWNQEFAYQQDRDKANDDKWQQEFDYGKERDQVSDQRYESEKAAAEAEAEAKASETNYTEFTYEEQTKWDKAFQDAESISDVERIADRMAQAGIDPEIVAQWYDYYAEKFMDEEPVDEVQPVTKPIGGRGGGGGRDVMMVDYK